MGQQPMLRPAGLQAPLSISREDRQQEQVSPQGNIMPTTMLRQKHSRRRPPWFKHQPKIADKLPSFLMPSQYCKPIRTIGSTPCLELYTRLLEPEEQSCSGSQPTVESGKECSDVLAKEGTGKDQPETASATAGRASSSMPRACRMTTTCCPES